MAGTDDPGREVEDVVRSQCGKVGMRARANRHWSRGGGQGENPARIDPHVVQELESVLASLRTSVRTIRAEVLGDPWEAMVLSR